MAGNHQVIPIRFLHEWAYQTGRRLPHREPLVQKKITSFRGGGYVPSRNIVKTFTDGANGKVFEGDLFESGQTHLRRYFMRWSTTSNTAVCRFCGGICHDAGERMDHIDSCYKYINEALQEVAKTELCAVCEKQYDTIRSRNAWNSVPVCSVKCLDSWDIINPRPLRTHFALMKYKAHQETIERD